MIRLPDLSPHQGRLASHLVTGAVVLSVAVALAGLSWRIMGYGATGAITVPQGQVRGDTDLSPALALSPFGKTALGDAGTPTSLPLVLKGVFAAHPPALSVAYIEAAGEMAKPLRIGETVAGAVVEGILRDRVILRINGRAEYLAFPDPSLPQAQQGAAATSPASSPATPVAQAVAPPANLPASAAAAFAAMTPVPGGGMQVGASAPPGLQSGDVITSIGGTPLTSQASAASALTAAAGRSSVQVQITRDGKPITLTIPTR